MCPYFFRHNCMQNNGIIAWLQCHFSLWMVVEEHSEQGLKRHRRTEEGLKRYNIEPLRDFHSYLQSFVKLFQKFHWIKWRKWTLIRCIYPWQMMSTIQTNYKKSRNLNSIEFQSTGLNTSSIIFEKHGILQTCHCVKIGLVMFCWGMLTNKRDIGKIWNKRNTGVE